MRYIFIHRSWAGDTGRFCCSKRSLGPKAYGHSGRQWDWGEELHKTR